MLQSTLGLLKPRVVAEKAPVVVEVSSQHPSDGQPEVRYERKMGDCELSYYLPSRANGVNDMCALPCSYAGSSLIWCSGIFISVSKPQPASWNAREWVWCGPSSASDTRCSQRRWRCTITMTSDLCEEDDLPRSGTLG